MLFLFVVGCVALVIGLLAALGTQRVFPALAGIAVFVLGLVISSTGTVDTKNVGVVTSWKKPTGEVKPAGLYWKAPWKSVTDMSLAWQTKNYGIRVQLAGGATADLEVYPRWRMVPAAAPELFQEYKDFDGVIENLFAAELKDSANKIFSTYNPINNVDTKTGELQKTKTQWAEELQQEMMSRKSLQGKIEFERVTIPTINPDQNTQNKLNAIVAEAAQGKILDQQKINADKAKTITETNAQVDKQTRCLEIAEKTGGEPGLCLGGGASVILNKQAK